jgi:hypothetical protein
VAFYSIDHRETHKLGAQPLRTSQDSQYRELNPELTIFLILEIIENYSIGYGEIQEGQFETIGGTT